ncbi:PKD domain-containing protein [Daejeonella sp.]|uniref:PKD domain-containing protein n=1 Tax=Daejeonella sp. TaxID=2805397 RepID=UPI0027376365|nr:PKD domain-containing protein [Daejeonella sp.]
MLLSFRSIWFLFLFCFFAGFLNAQEKRKFKIFQFPPNMIPTIDGKSDDWKIVDPSYNIGMDQLWDDRDDSIRHRVADPKNLDVNVKVGWVKGMNRLYFLYEAYDDYWDFSSTNLHNDIFEVVVDGDQSGGPFISSFHPNKELDQNETYFSYHGVHAQNYHIFTPARGKDWTMVWGGQPWIKELPFANAAYNYNFNPGESGRLTLEFWITPFDYAGPEGISRAVESVLSENKEIGLSWAVLDYDNVNAPRYNGFWNLSKVREMYGNASHLLPFRLMPLEKRFLKPIDAQWSFVVSDMNRRMVSFTDKSQGEISTWKWDFGDGNTSDKQHPVHFYDKPGYYVVTLWVNGPAGTSRMAKVWDVALK